MLGHQCCVGSWSRAMERIIKTVKIRKKRESFPETAYSSLRREKHKHVDPDSSIISDEQDLQGLDKCQRQNKLPQFTIEDQNQRELAERRRNFCITRSKSFAHPLNLQGGYNPSIGSYSSLSRKSSFSSLLSRNESLSSSTTGTRGRSELQVWRESQDQHSLFQVRLFHLRCTIDNFKGTSF